MNWYNVLEGIIIWIIGSLFTILFAYVFWKLIKFKNVYRIKKSFTIKNISYNLSRRIRIGYIIVNYGDRKIINFPKYCRVKYDKNKKELLVKYTLILHKALGTNFKFYVQCNSKEDMEQVKTVLINNNKFVNIQPSLSLINNKCLYFLLDEYINDQIEKRKGITYNYIYPI